MHVPFVTKKTMVPSIAQKTAQLEEQEDLVEDTGLKGITAQREKMLATQIKSRANYQCLGVTQSNRTNSQYF